MSEPELSRHHGGLHPRFAAAVGVAAEEVVDFSVNINPFGPSQKVRDAIATAPIHQYPDPESWQVRRCLGRYLDYTADEVAVGNGACELLWTLARLLHRPGDVAIVVDPTFSEYGAAVRSAGGVVRSVRAEAANDFGFPETAIADEAKASGARSVYLCCPTSPLGQLTPVEQLRSLAERLSSLSQRVGSCRLIVDESFLSLSQEAEGREALSGDNIVIVRSLTKELGPPGVRVGYLLAQPELVSALDEHRPRWTVSAAAGAAAIASLDDAEVLARARSQIAELRHQQIAMLQAHSLAAFPSVANYVTARLPMKAAELKARLLKEHHILVRDCASFGLPHYARFAVRPLPELARLDVALNSVLKTERA